jgi:hypothetical protein
MKTHVAVMASDALNLRNMRADTGSLYSAIDKTFARGLPQLISHDRHRLAGWTVPSALHFVPGLTRLLANIYQPDTDEDRDVVLRFAARHASAEFIDISAESRQRIEQVLSANLSGDERPWNVGAHALKSTGLARRSFPDLFALEDKDGLVPLNELEMIRPGVFKLGELCLFAHPYLRRSESAMNQFNAELLYTLEELKPLPSVRVRIRLDPDMVGLADTASFPVELDYWYGPKFDEDLSSITSGVAAYTADETQRFFHQLSRTEFWWQRRKNDLLNRGEMILEAEELRDSESGTGQDMFRCRYVHSVIDEQTRTIEHLDGAIRAYDDAEMLARLESNLMHAPRRTDYTKLWRVDGDLNIHHWKSLIHNFFRGNPLVAEYFGSAGSAELPESVAENQGESGDSDKLVPWACESASDFQAMLTRRPRLIEELTDDRHVMPTHWMSQGTTEVPLFDFRFLELKKILMKAGHRTVIPEDTQFLRFYDDYFEMPLIVHRDRQAIDETISAYREFLGQIDRVCDGATISLQLALAGQDSVQTLSLFGPVGQVRQWFARSYVFPPQANVEDWVRESATFVQQFGPPSRRAMAFTSVLLEDISLHPRRVTVPRALWQVTKGQLAVSEEDLPADVAELLKGGEIGLAPCDRVVSSQCDRCAQDFKSCSCSIFLDGAVPQWDLRFAFPYWRYLDKEASESV